MVHSVLHPFCVQGYLAIMHLAVSVLLDTGCLLAHLYPPLRYHGKIAFGEALRSNAEVSGAFGVSSYPTLLVVCGGNRDVVVKYEGERDRGIVTGNATVWSSDIYTASGMAGVGTWSAEVASQEHA